jgi:hypothetical protein
MTVDRPMFQWDGTWMAPIHISEVWKAAELPNGPAPSLLTAWVQLLDVLEALRAIADTVQDAIEELADDAGGKWVSKRDVLVDQLARLSVPVDRDHIWFEGVWHCGPPGALNQDS